MDNIIESTENMIKVQEEYAKKERRKLNKKLKNEIENDIEIVENNRQIEKHTKEFEDKKEKFRALCEETFKKVFFLDDYAKLNKDKTSCIIKNSKSYGHFILVLENGVDYVLPAIDLLAVSATYSFDKIKEFGHNTLKDFTVEDYLEFISDEDSCLKFKKLAREISIDQMLKLYEDIDQSKIISSNQLNRLEKIEKFYNFIKLSPNGKKQKRLKNLQQGVIISINSYSSAEMFLSEICKKINEAIKNVDELKTLVDTKEYRDYRFAESILNTYLKHDQVLRDRFLDNSETKKTIDDLKGKKLRQRIISTHLTHDVIDSLDKNTIYNLGIESTNPLNDVRKKEIFNHIGKIVSDEEEK